MGKKERNKKAVHWLSILLVNEYQLHIVAKNYGNALLTEINFAAIFLTARTCTVVN